MPCYDPRTDYEIRQEEAKKAAKARKIEAMLCAMTGAWQRTLMAGGYTETESLDVMCAAIDWKEAGVTPEYFRKWRARHVAEDVRRKAREADEERKQAAIKSGLAKLEALTDEERNALGLRLDPSCDYDRNPKRVGNGT